MNTLHIALSHDQRPFDGAEVLVYYDGPQLFWLPCEGRRLLAFAIPDGGTWPFLVIELTAEQADAVERSKLTARAACLNASGRWLMPDYGAEQLVLEPLDDIPPDWLPGDVMLGHAGSAPCQ